MSKNIITGIDIGTHSIKVIIAQSQPHGAPLILGTGIKHTHGLKNGYITNAHEVKRALQAAVVKAEQMANIQIDSAYVSVGGIGLDSVYVKTEVPIVKSEGEVTENDLERVLAKSIAKASKDLLNRTILHKIPLRYYVNNKEVLGEPTGMKGNKLSADIMLITSLEPHYKALKEVVESLDIDVLDLIAAPIAASLVVLSNEQKEAGCVLANIGAETVSIIVFEDGVPISIKVFPTGSSDITSEIALRLQVPLKQAEEMKRGSLYDQNIPKKRLDDIISSRLKEMFTLIKAHLKELGKDGLLPAGVILTGGGVGLAKIKDLARVALKLPSELAQLRVFNKSLKDSTWAVAYGLCIYGSGKENITPSKLGLRFKQIITNILKHFSP